MPRKRKKDDDRWTFTVGTKGLNRVTVYEREPNGAIHVEWFTPRRHRKSLASVAGHPVLDRDLAKDIAIAMSEAQRRKREQETAHELLGRPAPHTLGELLAALHAERGKDWRPRYKAMQEGYRDFWLAAVGRDTPLQRLTPAVAAEKARIAAKAKRWSERTRQAYLRYLKDAYLYAQHQLKWINESTNLSAVRLRKVKGVSRPYSLEEVQKLLDTASAVDLRLAAALEIAWATGRRSNAILTLPASAYHGDGDAGWITFPGETDKARQTGEAAIVGAGKATVELLAQTPAVRASGVLFPAGDLASAKVRRAPVSAVWMLRKLHEAERLAGVATIPGRGLHGIKRRFATATANDRAASSKQSGTSKGMLDSTYEQDDARAKVELARVLDAKRKAQ